MVGVHATRRTPFTQRDDDVIRQMRRENCSLVECAVAVGRSFSSVENYVTRKRIPLGTNEPKPEPVVTPALPPTRSEWSESGESACLLFTTHEPVRTLDQLIVVCEIDTAVWEIVEWKANTWEASARNAEGRLVPKTRLLCDGMILSSPLP
jgi:hypothetical protein